MREIKFRAWDRDSNSFQQLNINEFVGKIDKRMLKDFMEVWNSGSQPQMWQQYTGLKDKNGVEIYEGDILRTKGYGTRKPQIWEVVWSPDDHHTVSFCYKARNGIINSLSGVFTVTRDMEVIGNIYENPELLK